MRSMDVKDGERDMEHVWHSLTHPLASSRPRMCGPCGARLRRDRTCGNGPGPRHASAISASQLDDLPPTRSSIDTHSARQRTWSRLIPARRRGGATLRVGAEPG